MSGAETPPLTQEEARGLAQRWAAWRDHDARVDAFKVGGGGLFPICASLPLHDPERERLFARVRERMAASKANYSPGKVIDVAESLDIKERTAWALIDAAKGWPS